MMSPRPIRNKTSEIYGGNKRTRSIHLSFIFNGEGFGTEDINRADLFPSPSITSIPVNSCFLGI